MWSGPSGSSLSGGPSAGGTLAASQISPAFGPLSSDYGMVQMNSRNQAGSVQAQQINSSIRYQQYIQNQIPSSSFVPSNSVQSSYPVDPAGIRPNSYVSTQCIPTSSYMGNSDFEQAAYDGRNYSRVVPQQMVVTSGCNTQMTYRCQFQQQFSNSQQMRSYSQQQMTQMQQRNVAMQQRQHQTLTDGPVYSGIPSATQRTPGMAQPIMPSQVRGVMMSGYSSGMISSCGQYMGARQPCPISPIYQTTFSQSNQSAVMRPGPSAAYSQLQNDMSLQHSVPYSNMNSRVLSNSFAASVSYSINENKIAFCQEVIEQPITLNHNSNSVEYIFVVPEEKFALLQRGEIDVQLKGNAVDKSGEVAQYNVWPESCNRGRGNGYSCVSVFLNSVKIEIVDLRRSLYLGSYCQKATNKLIITSSKCICSHYFSLQYIRWKPVQQVISEIFKRKRTDIATSKKKVLKLIQMDISNSRIPLYWLKSQRITIPARSINCMHTACFDLEKFLVLNCEVESFICPFCKIRFTWNEFEIDQFIAQILSECARNLSLNEVRIDPSTGCYQIVETSLSLNTKQPQQRPASYSKSPASISHCAGGVSSTKSLKRSGDNDIANSSGGCPPSLKRIKSESFASSSCNGNERQDISIQSSSSFNPGSVPATSTSWVSSPVAPLSVVSPCTFSASPNPAQPPQQQYSLPPISGKYSGPDTPVTPGSGNNPASVGTSASPGGAQFQNVLHSQGSVEAVSVAGSAPYTPASVSSLNNGNHCGLSSSIPGNSEVNSCGSVGCNTSIGEITCSLSASALEDVLEELIYTDAKTSSASEMEMYLRDEPLPSYKVVSSESDPPRSINDDQDWFDFAQVMANES